MNKVNIFILLACIISLAESSQKWTSQVSGYSTSSGGYSGVFGKPICSVRISGGQSYRVHVLGGNWLPAVTGNSVSDSNNGYAGVDGKPIDGLAVQGTKYKVHVLGGDWLPEVKKYDINDSNYGMAGIYGKQIDAISINGRTYAVAYLESGGSVVPTTNKKQKDVVDCVYAQLNKPYVYGAAGPDSFDCSGLAYYCHGGKIPRTASAQSQQGTYVSLSNVQPGDLMFWGSSSVEHTTICIGNGQMIHAPQDNELVKIATYEGNSYWIPRFKGARRYWNN